MHIHQTAELAERVLLPGDPGRALRLAQALLQEPKMLNHNRGLWGYTGIAPDGEPLSIQSTGMGGPSAVIVASELVELGARRLLRIGTCGALETGLHTGDLVIASHALSDDGTSRALADLGELACIAATPALLDALVHASEEDVRVGPVVSTDLFYDADHRIRDWVGAGAIAVEMEAAPLFALAAKRRVEAGCAVLVSNSLVAEPGYLEPDELTAAELRLGTLAIAALSA